MKIQKITDRNLFDAFVEKHPYSHYMKTSMWGEYKKRTDHLEYEMLGFYEGDTLIGTAMVLLGSWLHHPYAYIPWGPCINYDNPNERNEVFNLLK